MQPDHFSFVRRATVLAVLLAASAANAQESQSEDAKPLYTDYGIAVAVGGGIEQFADSTARATTDVAGSWDLRVEVGTRLPVSVEAAYLGTAQNINGQNDTLAGTLVGTTLEGAIKANLPTGTPVRPFAFAGIGWRRYDVTNVDRAASEGMSETDNLLVFPLGLGLGVIYRGMDADLRFTFRPAVAEDLIADASRSSGFAPMHTLGLGARIGANF